MLLHKGVDEWTSTGVKSTFTVLIPDDSSPTITGSTGICGWGWSFSCSVGPASTATSPILLGANLTPIPWRRVAVFFHPDLIRDANYGRITLRTETKNLRPLDDGPPSGFLTQIDLPQRHGSSKNPLGVYMRLSDATGPATIAIVVQFAAGLGMSLPRSLDPRVEAALAQTIRGEEVTDIKFYAYTRVRAGYVTRPRPMFAKLALLRGHSDSLDTYLMGVSGEAGFAESKMIDLDVDMPPGDRFLGYDYMSDSDLDSDDEGDGSSPAVETAEASTTFAAQRPLPDSVSSSRSTSPILTFRALAPRRMGRMVVVKGHAFKTWNALLYYLYTNRIIFRTSDFHQESTSQIPVCSAKSMYKLADKFGLGELKALALESLRSQLSAENIVREAFSSFTSLYPEILDIEVEVLIRHLPNLTEEVDNMLKSICDGARPQCFNVLQKIVCHPELLHPSRAASEVGFA
ncbi:hypothetical protein MVEN_01957700 [Mycena venus]|uniref:BTB domain-containing protein n=1 Tax=Mycena venus TaxID=2733690 RepID=A0A8H6XG14_9AGAR|nr:hypothetical protein MVEN_01957700 [Mycena venus]